MTNNKKRVGVITQQDFLQLASKLSAFTREQHASKNIERGKKRD